MTHHYGLGYSLVYIIAYCSKCIADVIWFGILVVLYHFIGQDYQWICINACYSSEIWLVVSGLDISCCVSMTNITEKYGLQHLIWDISWFFNCLLVQRNMDHSVCFGISLLFTPKTWFTTCALGYQFGLGQCLLLWMDVAHAPSLELYLICNIKSYSCFKILICRNK